jgi:4-hydroxybenzoyl-CoA reductase beta subunit
MRLPAIDYFRPKSLQEALTVLERDEESAILIGGGTALIVSLKQRLLKKDIVVDIGHLEELCFIDENDGYLEVGSATTLQMLHQSEVLHQKLPLLINAALKVASGQVRNVATIGGNLCQDTRCCFYNRSQSWRAHLRSCFKLQGEVCNAVKGAKECQAIFSSDLAPSLIALDAQVTITSKGNKRIIPLLDLYSGKGENPLVLKGNEIVSKIRVPSMDGRISSAYLKLSNLKAVEFPSLSVAVLLKFQENTESLADARIVLGAISSAPKRIRDAEHVLVEKGLSRETLREAAELAHEEAKPVGNAVLPTAYRRRMVKVFVTRAILESCEKAGVKIS